MNGSQGFSTGDYAHTIAIQSDLQARLADLLARKDLALAPLERLIDRAEAAFSGDGIRSFIQGVVDRLRGPEDASRASASGAEDWEVFLRRVQAAGRKDSIESYADHLFTVSVQF